MMLTLVFIMMVFSVVLGLPCLIFIPAIRKAGFSAWWVVLGFVPVLGLILLWLFAYLPWPAEPDR